jgi:hypothetical protein
MAHPFLLPAPMMARRWSDHHDPDQVLVQF